MGCFVFAILQAAASGTMANYPSSISRREMHHQQNTCRNIISQTAASATMANLHKLLVEECIIGLKGFAICTFFTIPRPSAIPRPICLACFVCFEAAQKSNLSATLAAVKGHSSEKCGLMSNCFHICTYVRTHAWMMHECMDAWKFRCVYVDV